jgi:hypothetical protein
MLLVGKVDEAANHPPSVLRQYLHFKSTRNVVSLQLSLIVESVLYIQYL